MIGAGTHQLYLKWQQPILPVPPYYSPFVVAFVVEFICPKIGQNRRKFLSYPICSATLLCIVYDFQNLEKLQFQNLNTLIKFDHFITGVQSNSYFDQKLPL
uniref:Bm1241 n=1 Tax=Brugia malayi TaxID=6279 RepID=A0A1I9G198_BRUMA|nr:Bm1241 [Brugia malayi]